MVQTSVQSVSSAIAAVAESQHIGYEDLAAEYQASNCWLAHAIESCKRKIIESNGLLEDFGKKRKISSNKEGIGIGIDDYFDKENNNPNAENKIQTLKVEKNLHSVTDEKDYTSGSDGSIDVMTMKVAELRLHLRERGMDVSGLKKDLQDRLQNAIEDENLGSIKEEEEHPNEKEEEVNLNDNEQEKEHASDNNIEEIENAMEEIEQSIREDSIPSEVRIKDVEMDDCLQKVEQEHDNCEMQQIHDEPKNEISTEQFAPNDNGDVEMMEVNHIETHTNEVHEKESNESLGGDNNLKSEQETDTMNDTMQSPSPKKTNFGKKLLKATSKLFSPSKKSPNVNKIQSTTVTSSKKQTVESVSSAAFSDSNTAKHYSEESSPKYSRASMVCNMTVHEIKSSKVEKSKADNISSQSQIGSSAKDKYQATSDSKLQKVKPYENTKSTPSAQSKTTGGSSSSSAQKLKLLKEARKKRLDEIRNKINNNAKVLANKDAPLPSATEQQQTKAVDSSSDRKKVIAAEMRQRAADAAAKEQASSSNNPISNSLTQPYQKTVVTHKEEKKVLSPMETYEMSDRDESESDSDSDAEDRAPKKKIPSWAQKSKLIPALEKQFLDGPEKLDPDAIFPEVSSCDLEAIFDQKKKRYQKRTSSGNWTRDRVTVAEKLVYKRHMGF